MSKKKSSSKTKFNGGRGADLKLVGRRHDPSYVPAKPSPEMLARGRVRRAIEDREEEKRIKSADLW